MKKGEKDFTVINEAKKHKYGYGMHKDLVRKKHTPTDLMSQSTPADPELSEIKRSLKIDFERFSE